MRYVRLGRATQVNSDEKNDKYKCRFERHICQLTCWLVYRSNIHFLQVNSIMSTRLYITPNRHPLTLQLPPPCINCTCNIPATQHSCTCNAPPPCQYRRSASGAATSVTRATSGARRRPSPPSSCCRRSAAGGTCWSETTSSAGDTATASREWAENVGDGLGIGVAAWMCCRCCMHACALYCRYVCVLHV